MIRINLLPDHKYTTDLTIDYLDMGEDVSPRYQAIMPRFCRVCHTASAAFMVSPQQGGWAFLRVMGPLSLDECHIQRVIGTGEVLETPNGIASR